MITRILRRLCTEINKRLSPLPGSEKGDSLFNWDNCDFETNGEFFVIRAYASTWKVCFDVGANNGEYARRVLQANPDCRLVCFEPNPQLAAALKKDLRFQVEEFAVGDSAAKININLNMEDSTQSSIYRKSSNTVSTTVNQMTLDSYFEKHGIGYIDFCKIDTEGNEINVLYGLKDVISRRSIGMIQFEYGGTFLDAKVKLKDAFDLLADNYLICHVQSNGLIPMNYSEEIETYQYSNWVAISRTYGKGLAAV